MMAHRGRRPASPAIARWLRSAKHNLLLLLPLALTLAAFADGKPASQNSRADFRKADSSEFVGTDTCKSCHEKDGAAGSYDHGPHWQTERDVRGLSWQGCESCHGPGKAHVDANGDKTKIVRFPELTAEEASRICIDCHQTGEEKSEYVRSQHLASGVACTQCHSEHAAQPQTKLLKTRDPQLCYSCHLETRSEFSRPFHDPLNEGGLQCSDCHNPHGSVLSKLMRATAAQDQVCFKCHAEKSGPFVFEHAPVKTEGCMACHSRIHGSSNPRMLTRSNVNLVCLECHTVTAGSLAGAPPNFHNQALKYQACTLCHTQIHGSNFDKNFFH